LSQAARKLEVEHFGFGRFKGLAAYELAETGVRLFRRRFEDGPLVGIDPNAQNRGCV